MSDDRNKKSITFNATKKERHTPNNNFKKLARRLKSTYNVSTNKDEVSRDRLAEVDVIVFGGPTEKFDDTELSELKLWLNNGGRALFLFHEGNDSSSGSNINKLLEEYGITVNNDTVLRSVHYKYNHPKEVFISDGILVPDLVRKKGSSTTGNSGTKSTKYDTKSDSTKNSSKEKFQFVYPYGVTLNVHKPSRALLSTGSCSYPVNRPICSIWEAETVGELGGKRGRIIVLGSADIFTDEWIDKEENNKLFDVLIAWLLDMIDIDMISERKDDNVTDFVPISSIESLSQTIKPCLQMLDELPIDFTKLFDMNVYKFDTSQIHTILELYPSLRLPHAPLTLITPQFECPLPKMFPATFPPTMKELPAPALDLFDLDETFANDEIRLAQLTNKCTGGSDDLDYYINESGNILKVTTLLPDTEKTTKHILFHIFKTLVDCKKGSTGGKSSFSFSGGSNNSGGGLQEFGYTQHSNSTSIADHMNDNF